MSDDLYIPPPGITFRLLGYVSQEVIFAKPHTGSQGTGIAPLDEKDTSQVFTLTAGTDNHAGLYQIKSINNTLVLYARDDVAYMDVDTQAQEYAKEYTWFKFEPGTGQFTKSFRLIAPDQNQVIFSRTDQEPFLGCINAGQVYRDQLFNFVWAGSYDIVSVDYDLSLGKIVSSQPLVLASQTLTNLSTSNQQMTFTLNETTTETSQFTYQTGFAVEMGTKFTCGLPGVGATDFNVKTTSTNQWSWNETNTFTISYIATFPVNAKPGATVRAVSTVNKGNLEVPFTMTCKFRDTGITVQTQGLWRGVSTWDLRHTIREYDGDGNPVDIPSIVSAAGDAAGGAVSTAGDAAGGAVSTAGGAVGGIVSGVSDAVGSLSGTK